MKKYTIIYSEFFGYKSSNYSSITNMKYIECYEKDLKITVEKEVGWDSVWFILDGHCEKVF